jgi:sugar phosphate isomerase/epimerase
MNKNFSRREFLQVSSATAIAGATALPAFSAATAPSNAPGPFRGTFCLFSKAVPQLNWSELARAAKEAGFDGVDLTVRSEGHVLPSRVETDLPKAVAAIRAEGLEVPMITTELRRSDEAAAEPILRTAKELSIPYLKPGYYYYKLIDVLKERDEAGRKFRGLVELAGKYGRQVGYHNHEQYVGAAIWDMGQVIESLDPRWSGFYLDVGHAATDGCQSAWKISTNLVVGRLKMVAVKDFVWTKQPSGDVKARTCPLGQGFVPLREIFQIIAKSNFHGPISLHEEYEIPGIADDQGRSLSRGDVPKVMVAAKENLAYLKSVVESAYGQA